MAIGFVFGLSEELRAGSSPRKKESLSPVQKEMLRMTPQAQLCAIVASSPAMFSPTTIWDTAGISAGYFATNELDTMSK